MRTTILAAALAAVTTPALAQSVPSGQVPVTIGFGLHTGTFGDARDVDTFRAYLTQGQDYAFGVTGSRIGSGQWTVKGPTGTVLGTGGAGDDIGWGLEWRAGRSGYFTIEGRATGFPEMYPAPFEMRLHPDCRDDIKTRCTIKPGATQNHVMASGDEDDLVRLAHLVAGRTYTLTLAYSPELFARLSIVDATGAERAGAEGDELQALTFKLPAGTYYALIDGQNEATGGPYTLSLR